MTTSALIMIILTQGTVIAATIYFFRKVLKAPKTQSQIRIRKTIRNRLKTFCCSTIVAELSVQLN